MDALRNARIQLDKYLIELSKYKYLVSKLKH